MRTSGWQSANQPPFHGGRQTRSYSEPLPRLSTSGPLSASTRLGVMNYNGGTRAGGCPIRHCPALTRSASFRQGRPTPPSEISQRRLFFLLLPLPSAMSHEANLSFPSFHLQGGQAGTGGETSGGSRDLNLRLS